ncbi:hypothetical protein RGUI_0078 (plasmid) [Rhodovulum sp. P5]|nr:hypothetical protein RGUI_0078 [Rhodovulum sp. P5]
MIPKRAVERGRSALLEDALCGDKRKLPHFPSIGLEGGRNMTLRRVQFILARCIRPEFATRFPERIAE